MAKNRAPARITGGSGFNYEDYVAGRLLIDMLRGIYSFGSKFGRVRKIDWQARDTERLLDDLVITLDGPDSQHIAELSIKSDKQVTRAGFPGNFVEAVWEEWLSVQSDSFKKEKDLLVLVEGEISGQVHTAWQKTLRESLQTTPDRIIARLSPQADPNSGSLSSQLQRDLFNSLHCPDNLKNHGQSDELTTVEVLRRIRLLTFDFEFEPSRDQGALLLDCQSTLVSADSRDALRLCEAILRIAVNKRTTGGAIDHSELIATLRDDFELTDYPDYQADFQALERISDDLLEDIRVHISGALSLERTEVVDGVAEALEESRLCLIAGESGCGKSAIAKFIATQRYGRIIAIPSGACETGQRDHFHRTLDITHPLIELIRASRESCLLLFDAVEKYPAEAARLAGRIATEIASDETCSHAHVIFVSQFELADRVISHLIDGGVDRDLLQIHPIQCPEEEEIADLLRGMPAISYATLRRELRSLLRNLKILDWVARASQDGSSVSQANVIGLTSLITYLWDRWIEAGEMTIARSGLLKRIAEREADTLASGVPLSDLSHGEHASIGPLQTSDLLKVRDERVWFKHDLLGDWARLKILIERDPTTTPEGLVRAAQSRWHRAVRLYGKWLLDSSDGIRKWKEAIARTGDGSKEGTVVRDLILEAVVFDDNYGSKLDEAWPTLIENKGLLLRRILDRFLFVATIPDPRIQLAGLDDHVAAHIEIAYRLPYWSYWPQLLRGLHQHKTDIIRYAPIEAAKVTRLWLDKTPHELTEGVVFPWRREAAEVALAIAREMQAQQAEGSFFSEDEDRIAYEAALFGAPDLPDEVATFALELSKRRPPAPQIATRIEAARQAQKDALARQREENPEHARRIDRLIQSPLSGGSISEPWPDGPIERVAESFMAAILDSTAWLSLLKADPSAAVEVLLAVCIEEPHEINPFGGSDLVDNHGLETWQKGYPPMYFRGPFLAFFQLAPSHATDFAIRLINFATEQWMEWEKGYCRNRDREVPSDEDLSLTISVDAVERKWFGDQRVYQWHAVPLCDTRILPCVLMALEKYLYDQLENDREIQGTIQTIMDRSSSLAFAGLLIDVGKRNPALFLNVLRPLLGQWLFYYWDREICQESANFNPALIGWHGEPSQLQQLAKEWYTQEHRKYILIQLVPYLLTRSRELAEFLRECIDRWNCSFGENEKPYFFSTIAAVLDRDNYHETTTESGQPALQFEMPPDLAKKNLEGARKAEQDVTLITFPTNCMQWLDGTSSLEQEQLEELWEMLQGIAKQEVDDPHTPSRKEDAVMGGIAVFLCKHRDWIRNDPEKETWCLEQLQYVVSNPPQRHAFDPPDSTSQWHWDYFVAQAGVALLSEDPNDAFARLIVADSICAFHYGVTGLTVLRAFEHIETLRNDIQALLHMSIRWAMIACIQMRSEQLLGSQTTWSETPLEEFPEPPSANNRIQTIAVQWRNEQAALIDQFVQGSVPPIRIAEAQTQSLEILAELERLRTGVLGPRSPVGKSLFRQRTTLHRNDFGLDTSVIQAAFCWLDSVEATSSIPPAELLDHVRELQAFALNTIPTPADYFKDELDGLPYDFDRWLFGVVSRSVAQMDAQEEPSSLWKPYLDLGPFAHHFVESFFWQWFVEGMNTASPAIFVQRWTEMIRFALASDRWKSDNPAFYHIDMMVFELLGYHFGDAMADNEQFAPLLGREVELFANVAKQWFSISRVVNGFARNVTKPAYQQLLCPGIEWIHKAVINSTPDDFRYERDFESNVIHALRVCWERHRDRIAAVPDLRNAFEGLLTELASRGSHAAINLRDSVVDSLGSG